MKKLSLMIFFLSFLSIAYCQDSKKPDRKSKDYVTMKDGKMLVVKDGKTTTLDKEMTLADGTRIMSDGKVMMKDGSTKILKDGESIPINVSPKSKKDPG